jgi:threonine dehydrogenase-like Zn-dependent dehydrogenase
MTDAVEDMELMRAAVVTGPGTVEVRNLPRPKPGPGQVRIRLEGCGVCASNLTPWSGPEWMTFPTEPGDLGHEGWGVIDLLGESVLGLTVGQRVATLSHRSYAEYDLAEASAVVPLPPELDGVSFAGEPFGCAVNIFRRSGIKTGDTVAILGIGFMGSVLTRLASDEGARVIAISRRPFSLDMARRMGAAEVLPLDDHYGIIAEVSALTAGRFCDVVIEATGRQWPLDLAAELTRERGRLVIAGYHQDGPRQVNMQLWNWRGLDVVNAHERDPKIYAAGVTEAVELIRKGRLDPSLLITHAYSLDRLGEALDATRDRPDGFLKAVVVTK